MKRNELLAILDAELQPQNFRDYAPNGLQVEGTDDVHRIATAVTASLEAVCAAADAGADTLLVHHGWFWKGEDSRITGMRHARIASILAADMNLIAYHLPLDAHPQLGNNAQLAMRLGLTMQFGFADQNLACFGHVAGETSVGEMAYRIEEALGREPLVIGDMDRSFRRIAWCTGGAQDFIEEAAAAGAEVYISGEISERTVHQARELEIAYISAGHHATEQFGIRALGDWLAARCDAEVIHLEQDNPV